MHVILHLDVGGGEFFLRDLSGELQRRGVPQHIVTIGPRGPLADDLEASGIPITAFRKRTKPGLTTILRIARHLRRIGTRMVHTHGEAGVFWGLPAARLAGLPAVSLVYQNYDESQLKMLAARHLLRWPRRVVAGSHDVARFMRESLGIPAARLQTIHCGIVPDAFTAVTPAPPGTRPLIVAVGRLVERKGHRVLIEALPLIRARHPHAEVMIVGEGPCRPHLETLAHRLGVSEAVHLPGTVYPTSRVLAQATLFAFPSLVEPQGLALLEAFAAGVPAVASRTGGIPEMLEDERDGLLVEPGSPSSLAAAVCRFLDTRTLAGTCATSARRRLTSFHIGVAADAYQELYQQEGRAS